MRTYAIALAFLGALLVLPAGAGAATDVSSNWAGYAVSKKSVRFQRVSGQWTVPTGTCAPGERSDSVEWVGLGGLSSKSRALEQTGTQVRCNGNGAPAYSAWFELVPAGSHRLRVTVRPGESIAASVTVNGHDVRISLRNLTTGSGEAFTRRMPTTPDSSSAEWILEAPLLCGTGCFIEQLSDFGSVQFTHASAKSVRGHTGSISDPHWHATRIELDTRGNSRVMSQSNAGALPSSLTSAGSAFSVSYGQVVTSQATTARLLGATRR
jgi:peptidase A4-like protein